MADKLVSIVVPTKNSEATIGKCLRSIRNQTYQKVEIIVVDAESKDCTKNIAQVYRVSLIESDVGMSKARNIGAEGSKGEFILSLDSDMELTHGVIEECVSKIEEGFDGVIIPEISVGTSFWARCVGLEKSCYKGDDLIEATRFFKRNVFETIGGYDPELLFGEDKDFDIRVRKEGFKIGRISKFIKHDEGDLNLWKNIEKKYRYGKTLERYKKKHPKEAKQQMRLIRPAFIRNWRKMAREPVYALGMLFMKACEFCAVRLGSVADNNTYENPRKPRTETVVTLTQKLSGKLNLDAGCGDGRYAECFGGNVVGLDLDVERLKISREKYGDLALGSICNLPFKSCAFDFVLCAEVIEHIPKLEAEEALKELERVSNSLLITTPNRNKWFRILSSLAYGRENPEHRSRWSVRELRENNFDAVHGCLGWVTAENVPKILQKFWNLFAWYLVEVFGGDLIAMKATSSHVFRLFMNTWRLGSDSKA